MQHLNEYITEKLRINSEINIGNSYTCQPKNRTELMNIVTKRIKKDRNANLNDIDVSLIDNFSNIFEGLDPGKIDISEWNVSNATLMIDMFAVCNDLECDLSKWDVHNVKSFAGMFRSCHCFNSDLSNWDVSRCTNMIKMFAGCSDFDCDLSNWDVKNVKIFREMFFNCTKFDCDLSHWDVSNAEKIEYMFYKCKRLKSTDFSKWNIQTGTGTLAALQGCEQLKKLPVWYNETP